MKKPLEFAYFQLINGKMYPGTIVNKKLTATSLPIMDTVTNANVLGTIEPQTVSKIDTVMPNLFQENED